MSTSCLIPNPLQLGQHPKGELNENNLGSSLGIVKPHSLQALCSLKSLSSLPITTKTKPFAQLLASSTASKTRLLISSLMTILSITISILCLLVFSRSLTSSINNVSLSIRTLAKPFSLILLIVSLKVPFSLRTIGAKI